MKRILPLLLLLLTGCSVQLADDPQPTETSVNPYLVTQSKVKGLDDANLAWEVIDRIWDAAPLEEDTEEVEKFLSTLTAGQRGLFALDWCQKEIRNGGFLQFFSNSTGILAPDAVRGFRLINGDAYADLLVQAMEALGSKYPLDYDARSDIIEALPESRYASFDQLDAKFYELLRSEKHELEALRGGYVRKHPEEFIREEASNQ